MRNTRITLIVSMLLCLITISASAAPFPINPPGNGRKTPIDTGIIALIVMGAGLGIKKIKNKK